MAIIAFSGKIGSGKDTTASILQFLLHTEGIWDAKVYEMYQTRPSKGVASNWQNYWEIKKFAGKLKKIASMFTGIPVEKFEDQTFKMEDLSSEWDIHKQLSENDLGEDGFGVVPMTVREFLQKLGTEAIRNGLHENAWVNALFADYKALDDTKRSSMGNVLDYSNCPFPNWLITDMRFPNEYHAVKDRRGICVRVERDSPCSVCKLTKAERRGKSCNEIACPLQYSHPSETALDTFAFDYTIVNDGTMDDLVGKTIDFYKILKEQHGY